MAQVLYLPNGGCEILLCKESDTEARRAAFERIVRERLGTDAATLLNDLLDDAAGRSAETELQSYESSCDALHQALLDAQLELKGLVATLQTAPTTLTKTEIVRALRAVILAMDENL